MNVTFFTGHNFLKFEDVNMTCTSGPIITIDVKFMINYLYACNTQLQKV